ncbi:DUF998 domain-containing protein [Nakamurella sp. GG22]
MTTTTRPTLPEPRVRAARWLAAAGIGGAVAAVALVGGLHLVPETAGISPVRRTISEYALTDAGWVFNLGAVVLAIGSLAVIAALVLTGAARHRSTGSLLVGAWVAALLIVVLFPKHNWAVGPSIDGHIHRAASVVAFLCLPLAVMMLTRRRHPASGGRTDQSLPARSAFWLAVISLLWFTPIVGALLLSPVTGTPWWQAIPLGLVERGLVISEVLAIIALGCWAISESIPTRNPRSASRGRIPRAA